MPAALCLHLRGKVHTACLLVRGCLTKMGLTLLLSCCTHPAPLPADANEIRASQTSAAADAAIDRQQQQQLMCIHVALSMAEGIVWQVQQAQRWASQRHRPTAFSTLVCCRRAS